MRPLKRLLVFAKEVGVLLLGYVFSVALGVLFGFINYDLGWVAFFSGLVLTFVGLLLYRRKTRAWKIEYDAAGWELSQAERKLHPKRFKSKRIAKRILVWVPTAIAAFVLFFFPVATHLIHPRSHFLRPYRVPIPWNVAVFSSIGPPAPYSFVQAFVSASGNGRFGITPFWDGKQLSSQMLFGSIDPDVDTFEFNHKSRQARHEGAAKQLKRGFRLGDIEFTCWQYVDPRRYRIAVDEPWWNIDCETPVNVRRQNIYASFHGREEDIPAFYKIIDGISPVN